MSAQVVITGIGVISSIGAGLDEFETALYGGSSGVGPSELLEGKAVTAEVPHFSPEPWLGSRGIRVLDRSSRLLAVAAHMALGASGLSMDDTSEAAAQSDPAPQPGLVCGTMFGSVHSIASFDWSGLIDKPKYVNPMRFPNTVINAPAGQAAIKHKLRGVNSTICAGIASGLYAVHYAAEFLRLGRAKVLLAGGVEELCEESFFGFNKAGLCSRSGATRPFGLNRDGTVPGEGSVLLVLETAATASGRGSQPLAEVRGFGSAHDAVSIDGYQAGAKGATSAIRQALDDAGIEPGRIGCIIASAGGSRPGDEMEARALRNVFGHRLGEIPITAPKAALGETMGASGAFGAAVAVLALGRRRIAPTAGFQDSDAGLRLSPEAQSFEGEYALVNAFGCDGNNAAMVLRCLDPACGS